MTADNPRLQELRRRVQGDPASIAFAQLAEECRRAGETEEAIRISRAGLSHHPGYLSARVTLGRALMELNQLKEAERELQIVLETAPENLAAIRAVADIHQRQNRLPQSLEFYQRALALARFDPELEATVERIKQALAPPPPPVAPAPVKVDVEDLFDFDSLLRQLGGANAGPVPEVPEPGAPVPSLVDAAVVLESDDPFSELERQLREKETVPDVPAASVDEQQVEERRLADEASRHERQVLQQLEGWLDAIVASRSQDG